jgi:hypothetical protein
MLDCILLSWKMPVGGYHWLCLGWDHSPLFLRSHGWLITIQIGKSLHIGATKVSHHLRGYGHPIFWLRCALQPFGIKTLSLAYALVRINLCEVGWLLSFFTSLDDEKIGLFGNPFLWPTVLLWAVMFYFMAKPSALVILCETCSWKNILGGHEWH